ncbi:MAG: AsmA family protein [Zhongshania sp.]|uniref:AsmA family protein n=1 Tax=Zhongshania sp. TaxID=1971902 RepID=UPI002608293A|nr:AsmA family protein [Zhongshania sp.]MDF1691213.1 AsmA family protein [Zhongshania sp.]
MIKKSLLALGVLIFLAIATVATVLIQPQLLRGLINSSAQRYAGLDVEISDIRSKLNPLRFEVDGLNIRNPQWPRPALLSLANISISLTENPFGKEPFWTLNADSLSVQVEQNDAGEFNWISPELIANTSSQNSEPEVATHQSILPGDFNFNRINIHKVNLLWRDKTGNERRIYLPRVSGERIEAGNGDFYIGLDYQKQHFELSSGITLFDPNSGVLVYTLALKHKDIDLSSEGKLVLTPNLAGSELKFVVDVREAANLASLAGTEVPAIPKIHLTSKLAISPNYEFSNIILKLNDNEIRGKVSVNASTSAVVASVFAKQLDVDQLLPSKPTQNESPNTAPAIAAQTSEEPPIDWQWLADTDLKLDLKIDTLNAAGWQLNALKSQLAIKDNIKLTLKADKITELATQREINQFNADVALQALAQTTDAADLALQLNLSQQDLTAKAAGKINVNGIVGTELDIQAEAENSKALWLLAQLPWQEAGAVTVKAKLQAHATHYIAKGDASMGNQIADFELHYSPAANKQLAELKGSLGLKRIDLAFLTPSQSDASSPAATPAVKNKKLFSKEPIDLSTLKSMNADVSIALEDIDTGYAFIRRANLKPSLQGGVLNLKNTTINFAGGDAKLRLKLDSSKTIPSLALKLSVDAQDYGKLGLDKAAGITSGNGGIRLNINSQGASPHLLAANMNGKLDVKITNLVAQGNALNLIGSDVLSETIDKLNPFSEKKTSTDIECIAVHFDGKSGKFISDDGVALETAQTKIIGTGNIDLGKEQLLFGVSPIARTGVGINVGAAAGLVRLGGTFSKPKIVADPSGMFTSGLTTGAAIYTGGLSLLAQGLLKRAIYAGSSCDGAIDEIPTADELPEELLNPQLSAPAS